MRVQFGTHAVYASVSIVCRNLTSARAFVIVRVLVCARHCCHTAASLCQAVCVNINAKEYGFYGIVLFQRIGG